MQLAQNHQGVALGWYYLVAPLVQQGLLVRPESDPLVHRDTRHYLSLSEAKRRDASCCKLRDWLVEQFDWSLHEEAGSLPWAQA